MSVFLADYWHMEKIRLHPLTSGPCFFFSICFFSFPIFLAFFGRFPFFPRILGVRRREETLLLSGFALFVFFQKGKGWRVRKTRVQGFLKGGFCEGGRSQ